MKIAEFACLAACAAALSFGGCSGAAAPDAATIAIAGHGARSKIHSRSGAVPKHVLTWAWIEHKFNVSPTQAAPYLTWAEVQVADANAFSAAGMKTVYYTDPNRTYPGQPMYTPDESTFAHDCFGHRITVNGKAGPTYQMDPRSPALLNVWKAWVSWALKGGNHYDAIFDDSADTVHNTSALPCGFDEAAWSAASNTMNEGLGNTIIYNGLGTLADGITKPPPAIQLNPTAFGGMLEGCYGKYRPKQSAPEKNGLENYENSELTMSAAHRMFICRGLKNMPAQTAYALRTYMYASFLLTYDPASSVISEKFATPSNFEVMPESGLVALDPLIAAPADISGLSTSQYTYGRQYASCYLNGQAIGSCAAVVNADGPKHAHPFPWPGVYAHTLVISGAGVLDGGTASATGPPPAADIIGTSGEIAIQ